MRSLLLVSGFFVLAACAGKPLADVPRAEKNPTRLEKHGHVRMDDYHWLKDRDNPKVIDYLKAENAYLEKTLAPVAVLREELFQEMKGRLKEDDESAPIRKGDWWYVRRMKSGRQHPIYLRRKGSPTGPEEVLLDVNKVGEGKPFVQCSSPTLDDAQKKMLYACDFVGRNLYTIKGVDLRSKRDLDFTITNVTGNMAWAADGRHFFYSVQDPKTLRSHQIWRFDAGSGRKALVYEEKDPTFSVYVTESLARKYAFIVSRSTLTSEVRFIDRTKPLSTFKVFAPREREHEYAVTDGGDRFYIVTNWKAKDFRLMEAPLNRTGKEAWKEILPHRSGTLLEGIEVFRHHIALQERTQGLVKLSVRDRTSGETRIVPFQDDDYVASLSGNVEYDAPAVRLMYESMRQPDTTIDFDFSSGKTTTVHVQEVPHYDPAKYRTERKWITTRDGIQIPVSVLMKKDLNAAKAPVLVYGYGSYGMSMDAWFSPSIFSLVDRGWIFAMTHVRGGGELGRAFYDDGRTFKKMNTFTDFIDTTEALLAAGIGDRRRVYAQGGSAGGLLMGAVMNLRPDLYRGVVAQVPFVDVITTMLDDSIPLTTGEYDEWGNPNDRAAYEYILKYSPYDNVRAVEYPHLLVTTGLHDSQVQFWEPAKWVAKIREMKTGDSVTLLKTDLSAGHGGASGRYEALKDRALVYAFLLFSEQ